MIGYSTQYRHWDTPTTPCSLGCRLPIRRQRLYQPLLLSHSICVKIVSRMRPEDRANASGVLGTALEQAATMRRNLGVQSTGPRKRP